MEGELVCFVDLVFCKLMFSLSQHWLPSALAAGLVPDIIMDCNHIIKYLKYDATQNLLAPNGREQIGGQQLSPVGAPPCHLFNN